MKQEGHWESVYSANAETDVSWFQESAGLSLRLIQVANLPETASVIDVGGGASPLVDGLLAKGFKCLTVLDLSGAALATAKKRLGSAAGQVQWLKADILQVELPQHSYDLWHDRAVFHFLTTTKELQAYVKKVGQALKPGGCVVISTFAEGGPTECSGLPVMRYSAAELQTEFGDSFQLLRTENELHHTPNGSKQAFVYCQFRKT
jgi:2-polyprenyl-3-methyl-5-hydroxy-6-metoxy-1,4-benzoquinol methylase